MSNRSADLLFSEHKRLGAILTLPPATLFMFLSLSSLFLILPAHWLHIDSIPLMNGRNVGFFHSERWIFAYPIVLPLIFALFAFLFRSIRNRLVPVLDEGVITDLSGKKVSIEEYCKAFTTIFSSGSRVIFGVAVALTAIFIVSDTWHLGKSVIYLNRDTQYQKDHRRPYEILDWTFAYSIADHSSLPRPVVPEIDAHIEATPPWKRPSKILNLAFDLLAWGFEGCYVFFGFFCLFTFGYYLKVFADLMIGRQKQDGYLDSDRDEPHPAKTALLTTVSGLIDKCKAVSSKVKSLLIAKPQFMFNPDTGFSDNSLGLRPLGPLYNVYLSTIVILGVLTVDLRLAFISIKCSSDFPNIAEYLGELKRLWASGQYVSWKVLALRCLNQPQIWYIVCYTFALWIIIYLPIIRLRRYIKDCVEDYKRKKDKEMVQARRSGDKTTQDIIKAEINALENVQLWPNGDSVALLFLFIITALLILTVSPGILFAIIYAGVAFGAWKLIGESVLKRVLKRLIKEDT